MQLAPNKLLQPTPLRGAAELDRCFGSYPTIFQTANLSGTLLTQLPGLAWLRPSAGCAPGAADRSVPPVPELAGILPR